MVGALINLQEHDYKRLDSVDLKYIPTGILSFDNMTNDLPTKKVSMITGVPKEGKSTFLHRICLNAIDKGYKVMIIDGEHDRDDLINKLYGMVVGNMKNAYDVEYVNKLRYIFPKPHIIADIKAWHGDRLFVFNKYMSPFKTLNDLFIFFEKTVQDNGIDLVIFDNVMTLVDGTSVEKNENQSKFIKQVCDLAKFKNCHCCVVAHPNKGAQPGEPMGMYDVLGSSDMVNLIDYLIQIMRSYDPSVEADAYARIIFNRTRGANIGDIPLRFDKNTQSLFEMNQQGEAMKYDFDLHNNSGSQVPF